MVLGVPWDLTSSYHRGSAGAIDPIRRASHQVDLYDLSYGNFDIPVCLKPLQLPALPQDRSNIEAINEASASINKIVHSEALRLIKAGKKVGVLGGDHSCPYGLLHALNETSEPFGILHFDAHHDLRDAYEGFSHSHASIMFNALRDFPQVTKLVSIGIRDFSMEEALLAKNSDRVETFYDRMVRAGHGTYTAARSDILSHLPQNVYVSFDIDGLDPVTVQVREPPFLADCHLPKHPSF